MLTLRTNYFKHYFFVKVPKKFPIIIPKPINKKRGQNRQVRTALKGFSLNCRKVSVRKYNFNQSFHKLLQELMKLLELKRLKVPFTFLESYSGKEA